MDSHEIVICYRREDSQASSNAVYRELAKRLGAGRILFDLTAVPIGEDYDQFVRDAISRAKAFVVVIGPKWLVIEKQGVRRLDREDDPVRREIAAALEARVPVIPLLVQGAQAPEPDTLPDSLKQLSRLSMLPVEERFWDAGMEELSRRLTPLVTRRGWVTKRVKVIAGMTFLVAAVTAPRGGRLIVGVIAGITSIGILWALLSRWGNPRLMPWIPPLAWISTEGNSPKIWVPPAANRRLRARPPATGRGAGLPVQARIRRGRPFHQGTLTRELRIPESMMMGRCALRWNSTVTSESPSVTVAGMSMRSRKMRFACASS